MQTLQIYFKAARTGFACRWTFGTARCRCFPSQDLVKHSEDVEFRDENWRRRRTPQTNIFSGHTHEKGTVPSIATNWFFLFASFVSNSTDSLASARCTAAVIRPTAVLLIIPRIFTLSNRVNPSGAKQFRCHYQEMEGKTFASRFACYSSRTKCGRGSVYTAHRSITQFPDKNCQSITQPRQSSDKTWKRDAERAQNNSSRVICCPVEFSFASRHPIPPSQSSFVLEWLDKSAYFQYSSKSHPISGGSKKFANLALHFYFIF